MPLEPAITDVEQLKDRPALGRLLASAVIAVEAVKFDRNELSIWVPREHIIAAIRTLKEDPELQFTFLSDVTCVDWYPSEPRFELSYHLLSISRKERVRLKVKLLGDDAQVDSVFSIFPSCDYFEREVFDLFGVRFHGHPNLVRIMMPEDWKGHPLRKDYPVEGYR
ncbi:MAG TPA: NADH-quinone oxidoreductase subunit C [Candidatus Koribacter sp.]